MDHNHPSKKTDVSNWRRPQLSWFLLQIIGSPMHAAIMVPVPGRPMLKMAQIIAEVIESLGTSVRIFHNSLSASFAVNAAVLPYSNPRAASWFAAS